MISHENYMERIVDYYDGKLPQRESDALMAFLEMNPELYEEFLLFGETLPETAFDETLKAPASLVEQLKNIPDNIFVLSDEMLVAYAEKDLDAYSIKKVEEAIAQNPQRKRDLEILSAARYEADEAIAFPYKNKLLRREPIVFSLRRMMYYTSAAAAIFILAFFLWPVVNHESGIQSDSHNIAEMNLQITNSENTTENNSGSNSQYNYTAPQLADNSNNVQRNPEYIAPLSPRPAGQLQETAQLTPGSINDIRYEYIAIYNYIELKNAGAVEENSKTGTLTAWKDWGKGFFSGESSITDTPADVTLRDVATFSYNNISRFASESLSLSQRDR
ncbi:MAG TPA: hypothetical protein PLA88_02025 [Bacteroidales bacterium]|nr:hypothetical protein [Bacteroidales bacterium]